jgi:hypothetical protein
MYYSACDVKYIIQSYFSVLYSKHKISNSISVKRDVTIFSG